MSTAWYVESLLRNREILRGDIQFKDDNFYSDANVPYVEETSYDHLHDDRFYSIDFDSEDYTNLLLVERQLNKMIKDGVFSDTQLSIIYGIINYESATKLSKKLDIDRHIISKEFSTICGWIAKELGEEFTDEGYLNNLKEKYKLNEEQVEIAKKYMNSVYRHTLAGTNE